jgi:type VI secretion system secreted protein VgrG
MPHFKLRAARRRSRSVRPPTIGLLLLATVLMLSFSGSALSAQATVNLGNVDSFGALSFTAMTNAGANTVVHGNIGSPTSIGAGVTHPGWAAYGPGTPELASAQASLLTAYGSAEAATPNKPTITGVNLAGRRLHPGVYNSTSGILISGPIALTLDGDGDPSSVFIFQAASSGDLTVDPTSSVTYTNGAQPCNVFWKVHSAFLKNTDHTFIGTILALTQITLTENITVEGRVLARNADVTFIHDTINKPTCSSTAPPPPPVSPPPPPTPVVAPRTGKTRTPASKLRPTLVTKKQQPATRKAPAAPPKVTPPPTPRPPKHHVGLTG